MTQQNHEFPAYFDGSSHVELAEELTDGLGSQLQQKQTDAKDWRRAIGTNPFGKYEQQR